jgi:hypothetical protein
MIQDNKARLHSISANTIQPPDPKTPNLPRYITQNRLDRKWVKVTQKWLDQKWVNCLGEMTELTCKIGEVFWEVLFIG